jgi:hypothetical protein
MENLPTTSVTPKNSNILFTDYYWTQINDTWDDATYTWNDIKQQFPPDFIIITSPITNAISITNI